MKNGEEQLVFLNGIARSVIEARRGHGPTYVFTYNEKHLNRMLTSGWIRARQRTGLKAVRVHDLKHTFGRRLRTADVSFKDRQDPVGHRSGRITRHYSAAELSRSIEAAESVCGSGQQKPELVVINRTFKASQAKLPQGEIRLMDTPSKSLNLLVPRGGIEPPTP